MFEAVLWDLGGVILTSPFDAFLAYERELGLPQGFIRGVNATDPDVNAWARFERGESTPAEFAAAFEGEARAAGGELRGARVVELLAGQVRPAMADAVRSLRGRYRQACLTNNFLAADRAPRRPEVEAVLALFDDVVESSKVGVRKPEPAFYRLACARLGVEPSACVFLDDLGVNLKPARALGMTTIKVVDPDVALAELGAALGVAL